MIKPWMLLASLLLIGGAIFAVVIYKKHFAGGSESSNSSKEKFENETDSSRDSTDDKIVEVAAAFRRIKGKSPSTGDVRRIMKSMRKSGDSASDVIKREVEMDKEDTGILETPVDSNGDTDIDTDDETDEEEEQVPRAATRKPTEKVKTRSPAMDAMDTNMMRRVEDELEGMVNRIDGLLEEIQAMKGRQMSSPLTEDMVESFVPYHPV